LIEDVVEFGEGLPPLDGRSSGDSGDDQLFEIWYPAGFPDLVGEADPNERQTVSR